MKSKKNNKLDGNKLISLALKSKKTLNMLKHLSINCQDYEMAVSLREIEREIFPETKEQLQAKKMAHEMSTLFKMVDLNVSQKASWTIYETMKQFMVKKGEFSLMDATKIVCKKEELFGDE